MGKRSNFARVERDYYPTPAAAVKPLLEFIGQGPYVFAEPCAGDGALVRHLEAAGHTCAYASDINPLHPDIAPHSWDKTPWLALPQLDYFITNPPWARDILHPMITGLSNIAPTWLLFDADWMHTKQAAPYLDRLRYIVSVGRVKWIANSPHTGKDNCCWYLFDANHHYTANPQFIGRARAS